MRFLRLIALALLLLVTGCSDGTTPLAGPSLVAVHATWCRPCQRDKPLLIDVSRQFLVREIDFDSQRAIAAKYGVENVPTYIVLSDGVEVERTHDLRAALETLRLFSQPAY